MKFVLFVIALIVLFWLLRGSLRRLRGGPPPSPTAGEPLPMLRCAQCGLHLPRDEALPGRGGVFCGAEHRTAFEQAHPPS
ncbi:MAG TPA: PP0621 family protein [Burkholderiaceae bacterium]|nr:PP0621 family protein [Burkholderiaceae bacterium]